MIQTERLRIRRLLPEDWHSLQTIAADFARSPYVIYDRPLPTENAAIQKLTKQFADTGLWFAVMLPDSEVMIGYVCFHEDKGRYDLGYCFHSAYQGNGYTFESCSALMYHLEQYCDVKCFTAGTALKNTRSCRLLEKLGFSLQGTEMLSFHDGIVFEGGQFIKYI